MPPELRQILSPLEWIWLALGTVLATFWSAFWDHAAPLEILWTLVSVYTLVRGAIWSVRKRYTQAHQNDDGRKRTPLQIAARAEAARFMVAVGYLVVSLASCFAGAGVLAMFAPPNTNTQATISGGIIAGLLILANVALLGFMHYLERRQARLVALARQLLQEEHDQQRKDRSDEPQ